MLKKIMVAVRRELLKVDWIKREVEAYKLERKKQRDAELFAKLMDVGYTVRNIKPLKLEPFDTLTIVEDNLFEEFQGGKVVGQGYIDTVNWGGNNGRLHI